ncbi:MAG: hypothetical protein IJI68_06665 [Eggerthellaceae bacterium]|nr:hypothetical protein [Eggerthellaceae bacterium]
MLELPQTALGFKNLDLGREDFLEHGVVPHLDCFLLQVPDACVLGQHDAARIGILLPSDDAQKRRLSCTVGAN